jgi:ubiquinone/menaquinone biosynthesis C-methylase UbiE
MAERYHRRGGFAPRRKEKMLEVVLELLVALAPPQSTLLELGAGTGLFTKKIIKTNHFKRIHVTDGAPAMLEITQQNLPSGDGFLQFDIVDFSAEWSERLNSNGFDAVTSTMAFHHAQDKLRVFQQVFEVLKPSGVFVFGDHMAGTSALGQYLIGRERALERLGREEKREPEQIQAQMQLDEQRQEAEGNRCEPVVQYEAYLSSCGFEEVDCLWRDYWLAVFVARRPGDD